MLKRRVPKIHIKSRRIQLSKIMNTILTYPMSLNYNLYRIVKPFDGIDRTNIRHFGYRTDVENIKSQRLNKAGEQVLYTSTYPTVAERETIEIDETCEFYLVKYRKTEGISFKTFVGIDENCSQDLTSHSNKVRNLISQNFTKEELSQIDKLRQILETDYSGFAEEYKYIESSELASKILEVADCIITYSRADDGKLIIPQGQESNRFLNITFNKLTTDKHLKIETIYHCKAKQDQTSLHYEIIGLGIPNAEYTAIEWFDWDVEILNVTTENGVIRGNEEIQKRCNSNAIKLMPNVNISINDTHLEVVTIANAKYRVQFAVRLIK